MAECIEREAINRICFVDYFLVDGEARTESVALVRDIEKLPAADVAPVVHGRIVGSLEDGRYRRRFSCCGEDATMITQWAWPKCCPNCGAKLDGGDGDAKSM